VICPINNTSAVETASCRNGNRCVNGGSVAIHHVINART